jgi:hypothetical protein
VYMLRCAYNINYVHVHVCVLVVVLEVVLDASLCLEWTFSSESNGSFFPLIPQHACCVVQYTRARFICMKLFTLHPQLVSRECESCGKTLETPFFRYMTGYPHFLITL